MSASETSAQIEEQATLWMMRIDREGRHAALNADLDRWLAGDRRRAGALLQAEAAWLILDRLGPQKEAVGPHLQSARGATHVSRRTLLIGGGTAIAASFAGGLLLLGSPERYETRVGEIRRIPLADGSTAAINTASRVSVSVTSKQRLVRLNEGEVWFQVAKDRRRPFLVEAGRVRVRAIGTAFSVRRYENGADVLVTQGVVQAWVDGAEGHVARLAAGEQAYIADNSAIVRASSEASEVDRALSWRAGKIDLAGERLEQAAAEFNRYNETKINIVDPNLAHERFYGVFRTDDPEGFARAVESSLRVRVEMSRSGEIRIGGRRT